MKYTASARIRVNGVMVANYQGVSTSEKKTRQDASHWMCETEFIVRATLTQAGCDRATIQIVSDETVIEHTWTRQDGVFGAMSEGRIIN